MTGAPLPQGADSVVMVEQTETPNENRVRILRGVEKGQNICFLGEDLKCDGLAVSAGTTIGPAQTALLAATGRSRVKVYPPPSVVLLATGNEVVEVDQKPAPGQIRDCNTHSLGARLRGKVWPPQGKGADVHRLSWLVEGLVRGEQDVLKLLYRYWNCHGFR